MVVQPGVQWEAMQEGVRLAIVLDWWTDRMQTVVWEGAVAWVVVSAVVLEAGMVEMTWARPPLLRPRGRVRALRWVGRGLRYMGTGVEVEGVSEAQGLQVWLCECCVTRQGRCWRGADRFGMLSCLGRSFGRGCGGSGFAGVDVVYQRGGG